MFLLLLDFRALTNALPSIPTPAGSTRPRAKMTSTSRHAAEAEGTTPGAGSAAGAIRPAVAMRNAPTTDIVLRSQRRDSRSFRTLPILTECWERVRQFRR